MKNKNPYFFAFMLVTSLFFLWGVAHHLDPILIPHLKKSFTLTTTQSTLIDSAVFAAYFIMALPAGFIMKKFGYKTGIIIGLLTFSLGSFLFVPSANYQSYDFFLLALFIIACGLTILETAANPYVTVLGKPETATWRLNFAQSFNGLAVALGPIIGSRLIFTKGYSDAELSVMTDSARQYALAAEAASVKMPYTVLGIVLLVVALLFAFIRLPKIKNEHDIKDRSKSIFHALKHRHLAWAVIAQFFYIGAQVSILSLFILYATQSANITQMQAADYLGAGGIAFLIGRFFSTWLMKFIHPARLLAIYAALSMVLSLIAIATTGLITVYAVIGICFFMSIMFPTIFALGIQDLKSDTEYGSSLIVMAIVGGAIFPRFFGMISDSTGNIQLGYIIPLICFAVILFFGLKGYKLQDKALS